jgi:hypothetical protein
MVREREREREREAQCCIMTNTHSYFLMVSLTKDVTSRATPNDLMVRRYTIRERERERDD